jgi:hypothetical protein
VTPCPGNENAYAEGTLECGSSSYRFPPSIYMGHVQGAAKKAVAAATALQKRCAHFRVIGSWEIQFHFCFLTFAFCLLTFDFLFLLTPVS